MNVGLSAMVSRWPLLLRSSPQSALRVRAAAALAAAGASAQLVDDLVVGNRILANENILDGLGHISVRHDQNPNHFLLSREWRQRS